MEFIQLTFLFWCFKINFRSFYLNKVVSKRQVVFFVNFAFFYSLFQYLESQAKFLSFNFNNFINISFLYFSHMFFLQVFEIITAKLSIFGSSNKLRKFFPDQTQHYIIFNLKNLFVDHHKWIEFHSLRNSPVWKSFLAFWFWDFKRILNFIFNFFSS